LSTSVLTGVKRVPRTELSHDEAKEVLASQDLVRVAFPDAPSSYLIPLGYVWVPPDLCGVADEGHKTHLAEMNSTVSFQVDTSIDTGLWEWRSVTGVGNFEIVANAVQKQQVLEALKPVLTQAPEWWLREQGPRMASGELLVWKITPIRISGCQYARPDKRIG
jgi:nitroimidazol reductase NimA-like FMN-containing flavoprotein (pyridoxamine 5'-phosphate oxidase superfamily)